MCARQTNSAAEAADEALVPVSDVISKAADALRSMSEAAYGLEMAVGSLVKGSDGPLGGAELKSLQELDRLIQHLEGLSDFLGGISEASAGLGGIDASTAHDRVKMHSLSEQLKGADASYEIEPGEIDFF